MLERNCKQSRTPDAPSLAAAAHEAQHPGPETVELAEAPAHHAAAEGADLRPSPADECETVSAPTNPPAEPLAELREEQPAAEPQREQVPELPAQQPAEALPLVGADGLPEAEGARVPDLDLHADPDPEPDMPGEDGAPTSAAAAEQRAAANAADEASAAAEDALRGAWSGADEQPGEAAESGTSSAVVGETVLPEEACAEMAP